MNANLNNLNLNPNLNANVNLLAQIQMQSGRSMGMGQYGHIGGMVQPTVPPGQYNPSPIARPQVSDSQSWGRGYELTPSMQQPTNQPVVTGLGAQGGSKQINQYFSPECADSVEEASAPEKAEAEMEAGAEPSSHEASQEATSSQPTQQEEAPAQA